MHSKIDCFQSELSMQLQIDIFLFLFRSKYRDLMIRLLFYLTI